MLLYTSEVSYLQIIHLNKAISKKLCHNNSFTNQPFSLIFATGIQSKKERCQFPSMNLRISLIVITKLSLL